VLIEILVILWMTFSSDWATPWTSPFHEFLIPVIGTTTIVLMGMLVGMLGGPFGKTNSTEKANTQ